MNAETLNRTTQRAAYSGKPVFKDFQPILDAHGINYHKGDVWLTVGGDAAPDGYLFFLSVRLLDIPKVLDVVLPILRSADIVYRIARNELEASKIGNSYYGHHLDGKMIPIQPSSMEQAVQHEDFIVGPYYVYVRPNLAYFLSEMAGGFKLAIWSSADDSYAQQLVDKIKPAAVDFEFIWGRSRTTKRWMSVTDEYYYVKRLSKVKRMGFLLERTLIVDDTAEKSMLNYGNAI